jgi:succinate dehydrogenase flavin-adding protein (antitoxin of CptAB toxin-antitoxin module)
MIGVSDERFPKLNPHKIKPYIKAYEEKQKAEYDKINHTAWLNGLYVHDAIVSAFSNNHYHKEPIDSNPEHKLTLSQKAELWALAMNEDYYAKHPEERPK